MLAFQDMNVSQSSPVLLGPTMEEQTARLRADLRMGVPIVIDTPVFSYLVAAVETLSPERLKTLRVLGGQSWEIVSTARRVVSAETRSTPTLGGDIRRMRVPADADRSDMDSVSVRPVDGPSETGKRTVPKKYGGSVRSTSRSNYLVQAVAVAACRAGNAASQETIGATICVECNLLRRAAGVAQQKQSAGSCGQCTRTAGSVKSGQRARFSFSRRQRGTLCS